jgi:aminopeptidase N
VRNALEVGQIFDHVSYLKGGSVIRMLSTYLGTETFLRGVSKYLKAHEYSNATDSDLWAALGEASGQDVADFMVPWISQIGFPVVTVAEEQGQISVTQSRFLTSGDVKPEDDETVWWIPLGLKTGADAAEGGMSTLRTKTSIIRDIDTSFFKLNTDSTAFYRTNYTLDRLKKLGGSRNQLSTEDKIGLIGDAAAVAYSGNGTTAAYLAFIELFKDENDYL